ncbi:MAG TPA: glycoside hydrolase family 2 TIM barrel-domain containing protein [Solirubrobacter sp.]|nr:glycoside hydrolase family 2 TIM barrel-domain containing protein [Solirubrobacter sp.]
MTRASAALIAATVLVAALVWATPADEPRRTSAAARPAGGPPMAFGGPTGRRALDGDWVVRLGRGGSPDGRFDGRTVRVPYSPNARNLTSLESYRGTIAWYRTTFTLAASGDYAIRFESVNHRARVWLDGAPGARHTGAYLPFEVRRRLAAGRHMLVVRADFRSPEKMRSAGWFRSWFNFGGINREVTIRRLGASEIDAPGVHTQLVGGRPQVVVTVRVRNRVAERMLAPVGRLGEARLRFGAVRLGRGDAAWVSARATLGRDALWWPRRGGLQELRVAVPGEPGYVARVGLREVRTRGRRMYLNGRRLELEGAALQEDAAGRGDALTADEMDAAVERLRAVGANATRAQHALSPALLERLDAAGVLIWQGVAPFDVPGRWGAETAAARERALRRVRLDVLNARAHSSVLAWNLVNEIAYNGAAEGQREHVVRAARLVRELDPGRPVAVDVWGTRLPDTPAALYRSLDAIGATNYEGWYANPGSSATALRARLDDWLARLRRTFPDKVLVITEFGAETNPGNPRAQPGGLDYQADLLARHIRAYKAAPVLSGMIVWSLQDFALRPNFLGGSIRSLLPDIELQRGINAKGLFTYEGRPKPAARAVKRLYDGG